jgi:hypothetical protein
MQMVRPGTSEAMRRPLSSISRWAALDETK